MFSNLPLRVRLFEDWLPVDVGAAVIGSADGADVGEASHTKPAASHTCSEIAWLSVSMHVPSPAINSGFCKKQTRTKERRTAVRGCACVCVLPIIANFGVVCVYAVHLCNLSCFVLCG